MICDLGYSIHEIMTIIKGEAIYISAPDTMIKHLLIDSRMLISPEQSLFFGIVSKRNNGHKYILELYKKGVKNFIVSEIPENINEYPDSNFIKVKNTLSALQLLGAFHRKKFTIPVIGITGSNGKTIIKEWLFQLMCDDKKIVRSPKSYNSQIGVPLSVWQMNAEHDLAIFEAGISEMEEMDQLQAIIQPTIGIFSNIGHAHDENFINIPQKTNEKLKLFTKVKTLIYCADHLEIKDRLYQTENLKNIHTFSWSIKSNADLIIKNISHKGNTSTIEGVYKNEEIKFTIPFSDAASIENAIHCWATLIVLNYTPQMISERMKTLSSVALRLELKEGINNCSIINDSYNSDINSLSIAIDFLNQQKQHRKKTIILSDILQSGRNEDDLYNEVANLLIEKNISRIIGIGKAISRQKDKFNIEKKFYLSTDDFVQDFPLSEFRDETILLKGARIFKFEEIGKILQQKAHETVFEINLNSLIHNLNYYRSLIKPQTKLMAMVKAFSYGSGSFEISNILQFHQVDYLSVAYADEGIELRKNGITLPIMVMNPEEQSFDAMLKYNLEPEIYSFRILNLFEEAIKRNYKDSNKKGYVHLKLDTGMHRLGFEKSEIPELIERLKNNTQIEIKSVFSHLAASEDKEQDAFTQNQIFSFTEMSNLIQTEFSYSILRHILNSAGISRFRDAQFEMVRLGIGLYGVASNEQEQSFLKNVSTLKTIISQIKKIPKGDSIGYGHKWIAPTDMISGTIPIGYADGLNRKMGNNKGEVFVNGKLAKIIGNICMDMCMIDLTNIPAKEGDNVIIFGSEIPISKFAKEMETIPYEVLTNVSRRVKRVYFQE
ncbi:MAG TPA: bifunctional UDP-N-acetylmuramoyl-tripeptide:D-alanyl-D-alanine ligase/alanine racemase [Bacteroidales bacterium]|nr:bifunctional UDP-N-acetylmuramoyl-tripeptide:D-alanyl-D-alanine ligase/alanine racemase [Bacteroidales bacterium]HPS45689.1 bifunctional UDP-N-acetylmuramoyl-tripeptide:D-alanyl-D-alanine ligase/alanine racemase [Bacteroidales bacterium]HQH18713.1 bifunctional UDP-N-acetylmuramoyl-tripeptide:D-alanyl-D-alanine ligase/alanine racemase [Bacteroidales bacterium]